MHSSLENLTPTGRTILSIFYMYAYSALFPDYNHMRTLQAELLEVPGGT